MSERHSIVHGENGPSCATCAALPLFARPARCPQEQEIRELAEKWRAVRDRVAEEKRRKDAG